MKIFFLISYLLFCTKILVQNNDLEKYIYGNNFKKLAKFVIDENHDFNPDLVQQGDIIFVLNRLEYLKLFFLIYNPLIKSTYILITHNDDCSTSLIPQKYLNDEKLYAWFSVNADLDHPKLIPIPIGIGEKCYGKNYVKEISNLKKFKIKKYVLYMNFNVLTNLKKRMPIYKHFKNKSYCYTPEKCLLTPAIRMSPGAFLNDVCQSKFVLSPEGNGLDCYRTWEAMYTHSIPIIKTSPLDKIYIDLPVLIVKEWTDINEAYLQRKYLALKKKKINTEKMDFNYWKNLILEAQEKCIALI